MDGCNPFILIPLIYTLSNVIDTKSLNQKSAFPSPLKN